MKKNTLGESILAGLVLAATVVTIVTWSMSNVGDKAEAQIITGGGAAGPQGPAGAGDVWASHIFVDQAPYSAVGDGVTDDGPAITTAINAAQALANGGVVVFGAKSYLISSDSLEITESSIILRGSGTSPVTGGAGVSGTRLIFDHLVGSTNPSCIKIGHVAGITTGSGIEYMTVESANVNNGHLVWMRDVENCFVNNCVLESFGADAQGMACLVIDSNLQQSTQNWADHVWFFCPRSLGDEGFGLLLDQIGGATKFNTSNHFYNCKFSNPAEPGAAIMIRSTGGDECNNHHFVGCQIDVPDLRFGDSNDDNDAGVIIQDSDRNNFLGCTIDNSGSPPDDDIFTISGGSERTVFLAGQIVGDLSETGNSNTDLRSFILETAGNGADVARRSYVTFPYFALAEFSSGTPSTLYDGTLFFGKRSVAGTADTLFMYIDGVLKYLPPGSWTTAP